MPVYKFTFFHLRGVGETIRCMFAYANVPYEDVRVKMVDEWPKLKEKLEWGQLPVLEIDGQILNQSQAIMRYLGNQFGLMPKDFLQAARCDELCGALWDFFNGDWHKYSMAEDKNEKARLKEDLKEKHFPAFLDKVTRNMKGNGSGPWLIGEKLTWIDFFYANTFELFEEYVDPNVLANYPELKKLKESFYSLPSIKQWVQVRPPDEKFDL